MKRLTALAGSLVIANGAMAFDPTQPGAVELDFTMSGATASETSLRDYLLDTFCDQNFDIRLYTDELDLTNPRAFDSRFTVACTLTDASTGEDLADDQTQALLRKNGSGGSAKGVAPVCENSETVNLVAPQNGVCSATAATTDPANPNVDIYDCGAGAQEAVFPDFGLSDLGPTEVLTDFSSQCDNVRPTFALPFGVMVTTKLRDALQLAQGIRPLQSVNPGWATADDDNDGVENAEDGDNQPSLSHALLTSLTTGSIPTWADIQVRDPNNGGALTALSSINGLAGWGLTTTADNRVTLCHRVASSGTRAETEVVMNRNTCVSGAPNLTAPNAFDFAGPTTMPLNSGSSNMARCMTNMNNGDDYNTNQTSLPSDTGSIWAIGHNALEKVPVGPDANESAGSRDGYRYIRLDGVLGTFENIANGSYPHYGESTAQWENDIGAEKAKIADAISTDAVTASVLGALARNHSWGVSGLLAFGDISVVGGEYNNALPNTPLTRDGDNCQVARKSGTASAILEQ